MSERFRSSEVLPETTVEGHAASVLKAMGLEWKDLQGKSVLEIGAGPAEFAQAAKKRGISVVSLEKSPELWADEGGIPADVAYVVGDAMKMPFAEAMFDVVISKAAPPTISETLNEMKSVINEVLRVLKPGGEFRFGPLLVKPSVLPEIFTEEERRKFTLEQRKQRVRDATQQFLREHWPSILIENGFAILKKPSI